MRYVEESLNHYRDEKFFGKLSEAAKKEKQEKQEKEVSEGQEEEKISPEEKKKLAIQFQKEGMAVIKKVNDNFNRFKAVAGDKMQEYRDFWETQKTAKQTIGKDGILYNLYDSTYIVGVIKNADGMAELIVFDTGSKENDFETFVCKDKSVIKAFMSFYKNTLEATMKEVIANHKSAIAAKKAAEAAQKKEETAMAKKAKLDAFLKESTQKKTLTK
jgi:hypothetical protein